MPELPEVETVKNILKTRILNRKILKVDVLFPKIVHEPLVNFQEVLRDRVIKNITRTGKYLVFHFDSPLILISHLRMEGKYLVVPENAPVSKHGHVVFHLDQNEKIIYEDTRKFGVMEIRNENNYLSSPPLSLVGPDPFLITEADKKRLYAKISASRLPIKVLLLDQTLISGLGNIYVDETLFLSKIQPLIPGYRISFKTFLLIIDKARIVLSKAIEAGGSTIKSYHPELGVDGKFQNQLNVYGHAGLPCVVCGQKIEKIIVGQRGTSFCPRCQKNTLFPLVIGITGTMSSGKSTFLKLAQSKGYQTISSDEIVKDLYEDPLVINQIKKLIPESNNNGKINKRIVTQVIVQSPKIKERLEKIIHPLVKAKIIQEIVASKSDFIFVEAPLLFEAELEGYFDVIVGVKANPTKIKEIIINKYGDSSPYYLTLAALNRFSEFEHKVTYLLENNEDLSSFLYKSGQIIHKIVG